MPLPHPNLTPARRSSLFGLASILLWSTTIAFSRSLTEALGTWTAASLIYTLAGMFGLLLASLQPEGLNPLRRLPRRYLLVCGILFVAYMASLYLAVGSAATRVQVLTVGLINYLWPALSLLFSIPILGRRARPLLPVGILLALAGVFLATTSGSEFSFQALLAEKGGLRPYGLALAAAVCWALYSNLARRLTASRHLTAEGTPSQDGAPPQSGGTPQDGVPSQDGAVPLFLLASGLLLGVFRALTPEASTWSPVTGLQLVYMALFPGMLAYIWWDVAVRKGEIILVASLSYLTPLLSTLFSALVLGVQPSPALWLGAGLVIAGAVLCKNSMVEEAL